MTRNRYVAGVASVLAIAAVNGASALLGQASAQTFNQFAVPTGGSAPNAIITALDGNMYFGEFLGNRIAQITTAGVITEFNTLPPNPAGGSARPRSLALGFDGNVYFALSADSSIGRLSPTSPNSPAFFATPTPASTPAGLANGPDGNYWFTEVEANKIGQMTPAGVITEFAIPTPDSDPEHITLGADGNLWFTEFEANQIGRITPTGVITEFKVPTADSHPFGIRGFYDGTIWFTEENASKIGQISTSGQVLQEIATPTPDSRPIAITTGPDGFLWILESEGNNIGRIVNNTITEFTVPTPGSRPVGFIPGPDGALWFTERAANNIGQFQLVSNGEALLSAVTPNSASPEVGSAATVFASILNDGQAEATSCMIAPLGNFPLTFSYQATNPATNQPTGTPNTPVNIAAGASQTFILTITPTAPYPSQQLRFGFSCANANAAPTFFGVNTLEYSASTTPVPNVVAQATVDSDDGILHLTGGEGAFAVSADNIGASGSLTVAPTTGSVALPLTLTICQTNPSTGLCLATPTSSVAATIATAQSATFAVFGTASGSIALIPQTNRVFVDFTDSTGTIRGETSVAVETQ